MATERLASENAVTPPLPSGPTAIEPPPDRIVPAGCTVALERGVRRLEPTLLAGGAPFRLLRISEAGAMLLDDLLEGAVLGETTAARTFATTLLDAGMLNPSWPPEAHLGTDQVTVVIPVRDRPLELKALLGDLVGLHTIVVDDASRDGDVLRSIAEAHGAIVVRHPISRGPAAARNSAMASVTTPFVCFIDSDCRVPDGFLNPLVAHFADPGVAAVAPRISGPDDEGFLGRFERSASPLDLGRHPALVRPGGAVSFVPSATLLLRTSIGLQPFDEDLSAGEDVDLIWRLAAAGWAVRYEPALVVEHPARATVRAWLEQRRQYGSSAARLEARHGDIAAPISGSAWTIGAWASVVLGQPLVGASLLGVAWAILARRLRGVAASPGRTAWSLAVEGSLRAGPTLARQTARTYGPVLLLAGVVSRRLRRPLAAIAVTSAVSRWRATDRRLNLVTFAAISTLDDLAYGVGVFEGVAATRRSGALRPRIVVRSRSFSSGTLRSQRSGLSRT